MLEFLMFCAQLSRGIYCAAQAAVYVERGEHKADFERRLVRENLREFTRGFIGTQTVSVQEPAAVGCRNYTGSSIRGMCCRLRGTRFSELNQ